MNRALQKQLYRLPSRLQERIAVTDDGCWEWRGELNRNGYGRVWLYGVRHMVHRIVWKILRDDIGSDFYLDHLCRNPCCCNPAHLSPVTPRVNTHRGKAILFK